MPGLKEILDFIQADLDKVDKQLQEMVSSRLKLLNVASKYLINGGGKRMRPALVLLSARINGYSPAGREEEIIKLAAAVEMIHTASLIHDDILDESGLRRGQKTISAKWGNKVAVIVGDYLYSKVFPILVLDRFKSSRQTKIIRCLSQTTTLMCEAEARQLTDGQNTVQPSRDCLKIIENKTGVLFSACCRIGALQGRYAPVCIRRLADYGLNFGIAFQITDDVLDLASCSQVTGKLPFSDVIQKKITLPVSQALAKASRADKSKIRRLFRTSKLKDADVKAFKNLVEKYDGINHARHIASEYIEKARTNIRDFADSPSKKAMYQLCDFLITQIS